MCCADATVPLRSRITRRTMPMFVGSLLLVALVAISLGWATLEEGLGVGQWGRATAEYFWITFWIVVTATGATAIGYIAMRFLAWGIARPITSLAMRADELTEKGGTCRFQPNSGIREIDQLATSFNRLFALLWHGTARSPQLSFNGKKSLREAENGLTGHKNPGGRQAARRLLSYYLFPYISS